MIDAYDGLNRGYREVLDGRLRGQIVTIWKITFLENYFNKDKSVGL